MGVRVVPSRQEKEEEEGEETGHASSPITVWDLPEKKFSSHQTRGPKDGGKSDDFFDDNMANPETEERFLPPHPGGGVEGEGLVSALVREATQVPLLRPEEEEVEKLRFGSKVMHLNRVGGGAAAIDKGPVF